MNKRLYRSNKERMMGGVCGGIAEYFDIDPVLVRILFIVAVFAGGSGILAYIICWIIVPERPYAAPADPVANPAGTPDVTQPARQNGGHRGSMTAGIVLIVIGGLFLADNFLPHFHFGDFWPLILIALGAGLLLRQQNHS
jgi:phage shock protein C